MKIFNILILFFVLFLFPLVVKAEIIPESIYAVTPVNLNFNSLNENDSIDLYVLKTGILSNNLKLNKGEQIQVKILNYVAPKRGKRNGYFNVEYIGNCIMTGTMRASTPKDVKEIAKNAGVSIAGTILKVPGFTQALAVSKGLLLPNENESRLKSAGKNLYQSTPLKYVEKGMDFIVEEDGIVVLKLKDLI